MPNLKITGVEYLKDFGGKHWKLNVFEALRFTQFPINVNCAISDLVSCYWQHSTFRKSIFDMKGTLFEIFQFARSILADLDFYYI